MYPVHWSSKVRFRYKTNAINGELHRAKKIQNFQSETARIKSYDTKMVFWWMKNSCNQLNLSQTKMNIFHKKFCKKLEFYTNGKVKFNIIWATWKIKSLFKIKDNVKYLSCVIHQGICSCGHSYICETIKNNQTVNWNLLNTWRTT